MNPKPASPHDQNHCRPLTRWRRLTFEAVALLLCLWIAPSLRSQSWDDGPTVSFTGEIVDSKCSLGAMTPGDGKSHKTCAIECIKNGVPPLLKALNRGSDGFRYYLLVDKGKKGANQLVLPYVGDPVVVKGTVIKNANMVMIEIHQLSRVESTNSHWPP